MVLKKNNCECENRVEIKAAITKPTIIEIPSVIKTSGFWWRRPLSIFLIKASKGLDSSRPKKDMITNPKNIFIIGLTNQGWLKLAKRHAQGKKE